MLLESINKAWSWIGIQAIQLMDENEFGNLIFQSTDGSIWRVLPENPECLKIALNELEYEKLKKDEEFQLDWKMEAFVVLAKQKLGELEEGQKYCLKLPAFLGGEYEEGNLGIVTTLEQISFSGDLAKQIDCLPDGTKVKLKVEE